jgi:diguanylate cyclase (GGDEF)-like protein
VTDSIARYGGDEFVILMNALSADKAESVLQALHVAEKIQAVLNQTFSLSVKHDGLPTQHFEHASSASIGVTLFLGTQFDQAAILKMADTAMYEAKRQGTGKTSLYMPRHE